MPEKTDDRVAIINTSSNMFVPADDTFSPNSTPVTSSTANFAGLLVPTPDVSIGIL